MKRYPATPSLETAPPELLDGGHLWIQEYLDGAHFRFQLQPSGVVQFGDRREVFEPGAEPLPFAHAVRHVRETLDRSALEAAVDDASSVVFFAAAMHRQTVEYEWHRTPSVLGFDVWDGAREAFLPPDAVERVYDRLGLRAVNAIEKEVRAADFRPEEVSIPPSAWRDGPAAGVVVRNKTGERAVHRTPDVVWDVDPEPFEESASELASRFVTAGRVERIRDRLAETGHEPTVETLFERVMEDVLREVHGRLLTERSSVDIGEFRSAVAARTRALASAD